MPTVSDRLHNTNLDLEEQLIRGDFQLSKRAYDILGDAMIEEGKFGIGNGPYSLQHKRLRSNWHHALSKLHGKEYIKDVIILNSKLICSTIRDEMKNMNDLEPLPILMNGAMNVLTSFALGAQYSFQDPDFLRISNMIKVY